MSREAFKKWCIEKTDLNAQSTYGEVAWCAWQAATAAANEQADVYLTEALHERDCYHDNCDELAQAIETHFSGNIGEHSSMNCPWRNALELIETAAAIPPGYVVVKESEAQDAKRYQWLKEECHEWKPADYDGLPYGRHHLDLLRVDESDLDAAIDAAMLQAAKESKT